MTPHITTHDPEPIISEPATLDMDDSGCLWLDQDGVLTRLGWVEDADVPEGLERERARLLSDWRDSLGGGHEAACRAAWNFSRGV